jgi:hypothetical protein
MSYARFGWGGSDVYCFADCGGWWQIYTPGNGDDEMFGSFREESPQACIERLLKLREEGLCVPQDAIDELQHEIDAGQWTKGPDGKWIES